MQVEQLNFLLALGIVGIQLLCLALLAAFFLDKKFSDLQDIGLFLRKWGLSVALALSLGATALTLYYSDVLGFIPCGWCWIQRVFLWPQPVLFAVALWKSRASDAPRQTARDVADYSIVLSIGGLAAALYQHVLQMGGPSLLPCPASGGGDCAQRIIFEFGYITFPLMAASLFSFLIVVMLFVRRQRS